MELHITWRRILTWRSSQRLTFLSLRAHARNRRWDKLRLLSAGESTFKYDLGSEDREGNQDAAISVITRDKDGTLRHFYSVHPRLAEDIQQRGIDEINPVWNVLDLTPQGRADWIDITRIWDERQKPAAGSVGDSRGINTNEPLTAS